MVRKECAGYNIYTLFVSVGTVWYFRGSCTWYVPLMVNYLSHVALSNIVPGQNEVERDNEGLSHLRAPCTRDTIIWGEFGTGWNN